MKLSVLEMSLHDVTFVSLMTALKFVTFMFLLLCFYYSQLNLRVDFPLSMNDFLNSLHSPFLQTDSQKQQGGDRGGILGRTLLRFSGRKRLAIGVVGRKPRRVVHGHSKPDPLHYRSQERLGVVSRGRRRRPFPFFDRL